MYKIDYSTLIKAGFNPDQLDPRRLQLYAAGNGMLPQSNSAHRMNRLQQLAIFVQGENDGKFDKEDYILFWGEGPDVHAFNTSKQLFDYKNNLYSDKNFYFLTAGAQEGKRTQAAQNQAGIFPVINTYDDFGYYESDQYNVLKSGRDWFGEQFDAKTEITVRFNLDGVSANTPIKMVSATMAQAHASSSSFKVFFNNVSVAEQTLSPVPNSQYGIKGMEAHDTITFNSDGVLASGSTTQDIKYQYTKAASGVSVGYLNYFLFSLKRALTFSGNQTTFLASQSLSNPVSTFQVASMPQNGLIWDVTDPFQTKVQSFALEQSQAAFSVSTDTLRKFVSFTPDKLSAPGLESVVANQNLLGFSEPGLLIVTHPNFKSEAERLAAHRRSHNQITVEVVTTEEIYNEFSGGKKDVTAIRDFVGYLYSMGGTLDNLLLFGRSSYDYKDRVPGNTNFVPTYESRNSLDPLATYSSDDYFAFLGPNEGEWSEDPAENNSMDIGVGRISVVTLEAARDVVDKLIEYDTPNKGFGPWRQNIVFVADDGDFNIHQSQADQLASTIDSSHPEFITKKIYLDAFKQFTLPTGQFSPKAKDALDRAVEDGAMIVNFTGHGSEEVWMQERILDSDLIKGWKNGSKYPLFVTATCEFGRHDDPFQISSGEKLLSQKKGGAIGLVTTARPVNSSTNFDLNKAFYNALFLKSNGHYRDLGAIFRDTKNNSVSGVANRNFSLMGDPSMRLAFPENQIQINSVKTAFNSDTLKALSTVVIHGEIRQSGIKRSDFQGVVDATLFDRPASFTTLGDENPPFTYTRWSNVIFRGKASVIGGDFEIGLVVPKDLEADPGLGKLTLYANNGVENASGNRTVTLGGVETVFPPDTTPPEILLFIGDTTFINGGVASPNTTLVAQFRDSHGIAISGYNDSNSLVAILDDSLTFVLNDYYSSLRDDYSQGTVLFPLKQLQKGRHHIIVQASDTYSNRSSARIDFVVTEGSILISEFYSYPNPFSSLTESTILGFTHNRPGEDLDADLIIFDLAGHLVDSRHYSITESYSHVTLAIWDGAGVNGNKLTSGIYLGKLSVRSLLDGSKNEQITKLIIVN